MDLIFASHNENKVNEIRAVFPEDIRLFSLNDLNFHEEIEETGSTLEENSKIKAETIYRSTRKNVFADDTGLFVNALNGVPGVFSSRYAGTGNSLDNMKKLLKVLENESNRSAYFKTQICLIYEGETHFFSGEIHGQIMKEIKGTQGFGYDPIFVPDGFSKSFAEMNLEQKNSISHRYLAVEKLVKFIEKIKH